MSLPVFFPQVRYVPHLEGGAIPLWCVCEDAGIACAAFGEWTQRPVIITEAEVPAISSEPDDWGSVKISTPIGLSEQGRARWALGALAYALFDGVARASIANQPWSRAPFPRGRKPGDVKPLSNAERQSRHRLAQKKAND